MCGYIYTECIYFMFNCKIKNFKNSDKVILNYFFELKQI